LFDAPSDLIERLFPTVGDNPKEEMAAFSSFCPLCRGVQIVHKPDFEGE
jgi:hypothetical protein